MMLVVVVETKEWQELRFRDNKLVPHFEASEESNETKSPTATSEPALYLRKAPKFVNSPFHSLRSLLNFST